MNTSSFKANQMHRTVFGASLSRRGFLATGGALVVGVSLLPSCSGGAGSASLDATLPTSWIEIHADNTILIRTGKCDFGQSSIFTAYPQIVAEELSMPFEAVATVVSGDTDRTPDGGGTFGLLRTNVLNLRKAAAYTREAVLDLAAQRLGVARDQLSIEAGVISGGGSRLTYGEVVAGQDLRLTIPVSGELTSFRGLVVEGDPPLKPASAYTVVGQSYKNKIIASKVTANETWVANVKLDNMLHARMVHPATLGSTLIRAGEVDRSAFPSARVIVKGNLVGVVAETEWEAILAAQQVAAATQWTEWRGLPGHANLHQHLRTATDWTSAPTGQGDKNQGDAPGAMTRAARVHAATYEMPYIKHAPIGPSVTVADVRRDGSATVHTHSQNPQYLRSAIARMLDISVDKVVVRTYSGPGHYGRSNGGNAGSEDEAVLLSKEVGRPVRLQWMRAEDVQWSTQSSPTTAEIKVGLDARGRIASYEADHYTPPMQDDRPIGAVLAGLPTIRPPGPEVDDPVHSFNGRMTDPWLYDAAPNVAERAHGTWQVGQRESPLAVGLRDHSMRTPIQFQQNFPREAAINEAAALAGVDPLQFRIDNTREERLKNILQRLREETGWESRPSPRRGAARSGRERLRGQGVAVMLRANAYWACASHIWVTPSTGEIAVERMTVVVDPGIVVNPLQLKRQVEAGCLMGVSHALLEELTFDEGRVTSEDWITYPILTMADAPVVKVVLVDRRDVGNYGQGSEGANALAAPAIAAAVFDATGRPARRLPLRPDYVRSLLQV